MTKTMIKKSLRAYIPRSQLVLLVLADREVVGLLRLQRVKHRCASLLYANGVSLRDIQEWLGHSDIGTTSNIYTHLDYSSKVSSANAILAFYPQNTRVQTIGQ